MSSECLADFALQIVCGQNCTFVIQANGSVLACGEGSYGRLGQGNSDDLRTLTLISTLQGNFQIQSTTFNQKVVIPVAEVINNFLCSTRLA